ncbi:hypothetical protein RIF29_06276 [Crotalaria pallida]|uniref:Uncharacterized protein n=1 Tax=Crotalaria pallida TaxID=3830 RepID=A0AAN9J430_CROPI
MEKLQFVDFEGTTIENLPLPVENLKGLQSLSLSRCTKLSIDVLANMVQNMLSDFPSLKKLRLEGSNLTMIPESFGECHLLRDLSVKDSKKLKKIRGLPQDITSMNALNCHSLNIHTAPTNMVLKQIFEYDCTIKRTFWLAGKRLPQWFTMYRRGNSLGFLFRKRIPDMTVGLVARGANKRYDYCFKINNSSEISCSNFFSHSGSKKEEIFISNDLRAIVSSRSTMPLLDEWNYAEFSFTQSSNSYHLLIEPVRWSGVHVNRESMEDIQFLDMTPGDSSQAHGFALEQNLQAQSPALSSGEVNGESSRNQNVSEDEMETFYDCLEDEEAREVLKKVRDLISNDASIFLHPEKCSDMKDSLDYLSNLLSENDHGISREMITLISDASREFTHWSNDYTEANMKIECITPELMRVDLLQAALKDNMKQYRDVVALENAHQRKRDIFEEGKMIKTQRDELRKKIPHLQHEHCLAKEKQTRIRHAWLKLGENFNKIFID